MNQLFISSSLSTMDACLVILLGRFGLLDQAKCQTPAWKYHGCSRYLTILDVSEVWIAMVAKNSYPLAGANELVGPKLSLKPTSRLCGAW